MASILYMKHFGEKCEEGCVPLEVIIRKLLENSKEQEFDFSGFIRTTEGAEKIVVGTIDLRGKVLVNHINQKRYSPEQVCLFW